MSVCVGGDAGERLCPACEDVGVGGRDSGEEEEQKEEMKIHVGVPDLCGVLEAARKDREVGDGKQDVQGAALVVEVEEEQKKRAAVSAAG